MRPSRSRGISRRQRLARYLMRQRRGWLVNNILNQVLGKHAGRLLWEQERARLLAMPKEGLVYLLAGTDPPRSTWEEDPAAAPEYQGL